MSVEARDALPLSGGPHGGKVSMMAFGHEMESTMSQIVDSLYHLSKEVQPSGNERGISRLHLAHSEPSENSGTVRNMLPSSIRVFKDPYKPISTNVIRVYIHVPRGRVWGSQVGLPTGFGISLNFLAQPTLHSSTTTPKILHM